MKEPQASLPRFRGGLWLSLLALCSITCGGGDIVAPPPPSLSGTILTFVSGENGAPVGRAKVEIGGATYTTDVAGRIGVPHLQEGAPLQVTAWEFLPRRTITAAGARTYSLWPVPFGTTEDYFRVLIYTTAFAPPMPRALQRITAPAVELVVDDRHVRRDAEIMATVEAATAEVTAATGGAVRMSVVWAPTESVPAFYLVSDREDPVFRGPTPPIAAAYVNVTNGSITGGRLVFFSMETMRRAHHLLHELGHALGLGHSSKQEIMASSSAAGTSYFPTERLALAMMYQRLPLNAFPDDDTAVARTASSRGIERIVYSCGEARR
jgi:hypothetical protein